MQRYKIKIEYEGTPFVGWQFQKNGQSVQEVLQKAIFNFSKENVVVTGAGRTDSGVHALAQVAHFDLKKKIKGKKLSIIGANLLIESLKNIEEDNSKFVDQAHSEATYAKKIDKGETKINWNLDAHKVLAHIHGLSPSPGAWFEYENERFKVLRARISTTNGKSSSVLDENLTIACKSDSIQILEIQRQGKNKQTTKNFLLGKKISKGSILT